jgi:hypothetical protein
LLGHVRHSIRSLLRTPGFTLTVVHDHVAKAEHLFSGICMGWPVVVSNL